VPVDPRKLPIAESRKLMNDPCVFVAAKRHRY
jgi:hypothetical protein